MSVVNSSGMTCNIENLDQIARQVRATCIKMAYCARESHVSSALSCVEILVALFGCFLRSPCKSDDPDRDRFILSKGHGCSALYATLAAFDIIPASSLVDYATQGASLPNHPCQHALPLLDASSGSLGHGLGIATGMLYGLNLRKKHEPRAVVVLGDGECNEGSVWEAAMFAASQHLSNLVVVVDANGSQAVGQHADLTGETSLAEKFRSFGWAVTDVDGQSMVALCDALSTLPLAQDRPSAIIAHTVSGAGLSFTEGQQFWFYRRPDENDLKSALEELNIDPLF